MIVSHARKFIFIKTKKTAGTSLEIALTRYCGPDDVVTELVDYDEAKRRELVGAGARNFTRGFGELSPADKLRFVLRDRRSAQKLKRSLVKFDEHEPAHRLRTLIGPEAFDGYFKFTIVRNPFDRAVSRYFWTLKNGDPEVERWGVRTFSQFLRYLPGHVNENWKIYTHADRVLVDDFVRYEHLEADLARISARIGLPHNVFDDFKSIQTKTGIRPKDIDYDEIISADDRALIHQLCLGEIERFGYSFEDLKNAA